MIQLLHQRQQAVKLTGRETLSGKPVQVLPWKLRNQVTFVFAVRHDGGHKTLSLRQAGRVVTAVNVPIKQAAWAGGR